MAGSSSPDSTAMVANENKKRPADSANGDHRPKRPVKRRASKACSSCRARKVRCNVVEHGAPCTNCRLDQVECVIAESKRKRKSISRVGLNSAAAAAASSNRPSYMNANSQGNGWQPRERRPSDLSSPSQHVPHSLYQHHASQDPHHNECSRGSLSSADSDAAHSHPTRALPLGYRSAYSPNMVSPPPSAAPLPENISPLPDKMSPEDAEFLQHKGALSLPAADVRDEILKSYIEYVDPFMPVLDLREFLRTVESGDGKSEKISLQVFQAVMFAGSAFVDINCLLKAGYYSRREARRSFFLKARLLYDFDYDTDRLNIVQSVLLMTYWWDAPDDQKDTWHWMGIAVSMAQSIGLNNDPSKSHLDLRRQRQWKRIWWSCLTRDRLISIGMRRISRIKCTDHDVPLPTLEDFDLRPLPTNFSYISPGECPVAQETSTRRALAVMFIEKSKLSLLIGNVMSHYSPPGQRLDEEGRAKLAGLSVPKRSLNMSDIRQCHEQLQSWFAKLPPEVQVPYPSHYPAGSGNAPVMLHRALLHLIYNMTVSTLHRPLPNAEATYPTPDGKTFEAPRVFVRLSAHRITEIVQSLLERGYQRFLPTTGITALQPALISHLIDIKSPSHQTRREGLRGFCRCIHVMSKLRDCYSAADYTMVMIETSVRKADIDISDWAPANHKDPLENGFMKPRKAFSIEDLVDAGLRHHLVAPVTVVRSDGGAQPLTPPSEDAFHPDSNAHAEHVKKPARPQPLLSDSAVAKRLEQFLAPTPPASAPADETQSDENSPPTLQQNTYGSHLVPPPHAYAQQVPSVSSPNLFDQGQTSLTPNLNPSTPNPNHVLGGRSTPALRELDRDFENLINADPNSAAFGDSAFAFGGPDGGFASLQGESSGFFMDADWLNEGVFGNAAGAFGAGAGMHAPPSMATSVPASGAASVVGGGGEMEMDGALSRVHSGGSFASLESGASGAPLQRMHSGGSFASADGVGA